jgi:aspartate oxidase
VRACEQPSEPWRKGAKVGVVCKSLLGKAHTVMAEGGIAAAMANVDSADDWRTHFRDTMRGGKLLNNWRMAQIHAQEAPERVRELEQWGALFDRTQDGQILQRAFGGHTFRRLCHVGDRTGLEMIRTLQDRGVQLGIDVYMECAISRLLLRAGNRDVHDDSKATTLPIAREIVATCVTNGAKLPWYIDLLNLNLDNHDLVAAKARIQAYIETFEQDGTRVTENLDF